MNFQNDMMKALIGYYVGLKEAKNRSRDCGGNEERLER